MVLLICLPREQAAAYCKDTEKTEGYQAWIIGIVEKGIPDGADIIDKPRLIEVPARRRTELVVAAAARRPHSATAARRLSFGALLVARMERCGSAGRELWLVPDEALRPSRGVTAGRRCSDGRRTAARMTRRGYSALPAPRG